MTVVGILDHEWGKTVPKMYPQIGQLKPEPGFKTCNLEMMVYMRRILGLEEHKWQEDYDEAMSDQNRPLDQNQPERSTSMPREDQTSLTLTAGTGGLP